MRYLSLFSGIEAASVAWERLGWECAAVAEIEPFPCKVLAHRYPDVPNLGDITQITQERIEALGHIDLVVFGAPCFVAGTMILSQAGFVPIESLRVGDQVLSHTGAWRSVTSIMRRNAKNLRRVRGAGVLETTTTDEHPYYTRQRGRLWDNERRSYARTFTPPTWTEAQEISATSGHFAGQVLPGAKDDCHAEAWWWLVGRYLADGWVRDRSDRPTGNVVICCGKHEVQEMTDRLAGAGVKASLVEERTVFKFHVHNKRFHDFLRPFGRLAHGKTLPGFCLELAKEKAAALFNGWASGDGWRNENHRQISVTTVSKSLALGMALLAQRAFGIVAGVYFAPMPETCEIEGRVCNQRGQYAVRVCDINRSSFIDGDYGWKLLRQSEPCGEGEVFNISVSEDESYVANGAIVHNCQDLSVAGKRKGMLNEDGSPTRSGLFYAAERIATWAGARWAIYENVPGMFSSNAGADFASVVGEMAGAEFDVPKNKWRNAGVAVGPRGLVEWVTLDAQYVRTPEFARAVPQRRRRVFVVRDSGDWASRPPLFLEPESMRGNPPPSRTPGKTVAHDVAGSLVSSGRGVSRTGDTRGQDPVIAVARSLAIRGRDGTPQIEMGGEVANALLTPSGGRGGIGIGAVCISGEVSHTLSSEGFDASEDGTGRGTPIVARCLTTGEGARLDGESCNFIAVQGSVIGSTDHAGPAGSGVDETGACFTLTKTDTHAVAFSIRTANTSSNGCGISDGLAYTLDQAQGQAVAFAQNTRDEVRLIAGDGGVIGAMAAQPGMKQQSCVAIGWSEELTASENVGPTLQRGGQGGRHDGVMTPAMQVRRLTPLECERLQGFPDQWTNIPGASDSTRYKALGNSFAVNVVHYLGEKIQRIEKWEKYEPLQNM